MGKAISKIINKLKGRESIRMVLLGLDSAGKTTILYMLKLGELVHTIPTIGFNVESLVYKNIRLDCWDAGGQEVFRNMWRHYTSDCHGVIFVIDSADPERLEEAGEEMMKIMADESLTNAALLIIANKQDMENAMSSQEISEKLKLDTKIKQPHHIQPAVATSGEGLVEGVDWLVEAIKKIKKS